VQRQAFALEDSQVCIQELKQAEVFTGRIQHFGPYICRAGIPRYVHKNVSEMKDKGRNGS
jgi:hypothetical protein